MAGPGEPTAGEHIRWEEAGPDTARAVVTHGALEQAVEITLAPDGLSRSVIIQRWSSENLDKSRRLQLFGGHLSQYREFSGNRLPTCIEGGNDFGTEEYFPFFRTEIPTSDWDRAHEP
ncbi:DUF6544 family protein [Rhodophyticola sp.]|jgi:hypothetical protein|uniref:DUF6544 family protein n=1 Tax=Rhodophyticola sp. TaxID=2680032 RepID=UPI003D2A6A1C